MLRKNFLWMHLTQNSSTTPLIRGLCERDFYGCTSLVAVNVLDLSSTYVYGNTFTGCLSPISIALSKDCHIYGNNTDLFDGCTALDQ